MKRVEGFWGRCGWLTLFTAVAGGIAYPILQSLFGPESWYWLAGSAGICLLPGWLVFFIVSRYRVSSHQGLAALAGSGIRLFLVAGGVLVVDQKLGVLPIPCVVSICLFYLVTLAAETVLLLPEPKPAKTETSALIK